MCHWSSRSHTRRPWRGCATRWLTAHRTGDEAGLVTCLHRKYLVPHVILWVHPNGGRPPSACMFPKRNLVAELLRSWDGARDYGLRVGSRSPAARLAEANMLAYLLLGHEGGQSCGTHQQRGDVSCHGHAVILGHRPPLWSRYHR